jgi:hypothetical protein
LLCFFLTKVITYQVRKYPHEGQRSMRVKPDGFTLSSRCARALKALARPFAHVSRELRFPVHGSFLTKNFAGLLYAPPGNSKPAYIPDSRKSKPSGHPVEQTLIYVLCRFLILLLKARFQVVRSGMRSGSFNPRANGGVPPGDAHGGNEAGIHVLRRLEGRDKSVSFGECPGPLCRS